jgi:hypothetical protein
MNNLELDHIVIAATSLETGVDYIQQRLGVRIPAGGEHPLMGTHNCLMRLGPSAFLEVISIDPAAPAPSRARWYGLDDPALQAQLHEQPRLITWVMRSDNIERDAQAVGYAPEESIDVSRGTLNWRLTVPEDGHLPWSGVFPHIIEWNDGARPWEAMADFDCGLEKLTLSHPDEEALSEAMALLMLERFSFIERVTAPQPGISVRITKAGEQFTL